MIFTKTMKMLATVLAILAVFAALVPLAVGQSLQSEASADAVEAHAAVTKQGEFAAVAFQKGNTTYVRHAVATAGGVRLAIAKPQGINPRELVLDLIHRVGAQVPMHVEDGLAAFAGSQYDSVLIRDAVSGKHLQTRICKPSDVPTHWRGMVWVDGCGEINTYVRAGGKCWANLKPLSKGCALRLMMSKSSCRMVAQTWFVMSDSGANEVGIEDSEGQFCVLIPVVRPDANIKVVAKSSCKIVYQGKCGSLGKKAFVHNTDPGSSRLATVEVTRTVGIQTDVYQKVFAIPAGGKTLVGCTEGVGFPRPTYSYRVIGCERP